MLCHLPEFREIKATLYTEAGGHRSSASNHNTHVPSPRASLQHSVTSREVAAVNRTICSRGVQEQNQYFQSLPFPLVNSHSHLNSVTSFHSLPNHCRKTMKASKTVQCQISKIVICNASLTTIYQLQSTNTQVL